MNGEEGRELHNLIVDVAVLKAIGERNEKILHEIKKEVIGLRIKNAGVAAITSLLVTGILAVIIKALS